MKILTIPKSKDSPFHNATPEERKKIMQEILKELEKSPTSFEDRHKELQTIRGDY